MQNFQTHKSTAPKLKICDEADFYTFTTLQVTPNLQLLSA